MAGELIQRIGGIGTPDDVKAALVVSRVVSALDHELARLRGLFAVDDLTALESSWPTYAAVANDLADTLSDLTGGSALIDGTQVFRRAGLHLAVADVLLAGSDLKARA